MQDYDRKYLKNLFAEHNMVNLDYLNNPELLAASLGDVDIKGSSTNIIKQAINLNSKLMAVQYVANNKAFKAVNIDSMSDDKSSSTANAKPVTMAAFDARIRLTSQDKYSMSNMQANKIADSDMHGHRDTSGTKTMANVKTLSRVIEENEGKNGLQSGTNLARPMTGNHAKYRNIFSATTNANSQGTKLRSKLAGRE